MKRFRSTRDVLAEVREVLAQPPQVGGVGPLPVVIAALEDGRGFAAVGIYLSVRDRLLREWATAGQPSELSSAMSQADGQSTAPLKIGGRIHGALHVEADPQRGFAADDRVLIKEVASALAQFLTGRGRYIVRAARERSAGTPGKHEPQADRSAGRRAAAGESARS